MSKVASCKGQVTNYDLRFTIYASLSAHPQMRSLSVASCFVALLLLVACAGGSGPVVSANVVEALNAPINGDFARAIAPMEFVFPRDHGAHPDFRTEWWYYTGNLAAKDGSSFGYQLTFFRTGLTPGIESRASDWAANQIFMAHFAVTDGNGQDHTSFERFSRGAGGLAGVMGEPSYEIWLDNWSVRSIENGVTELRASEMGEQGLVAVALTLRETRPPLLHGERGLSQKGNDVGNANYYYSQVQIETIGTITIGTKISNVQGVSWMDHEFGTNAVSANAVGWDWFSVQLDNSVVLMFAQVRSKDGSTVGNFAGTLADASGGQRTLSAEDFSMKANGEWTSPRTGITYPSDWQVTLPALKLELALQPLVEDQEMDVSFVYWEGAINVAGTMDGQPVSGHGYVELTGYGESGGEYQR